MKKPEPELEDSVCGVSGPRDPGKITSTGSCKACDALVGCSVLDHKMFYKDFSLSVKGRYGYLPNCFYEAF